MSTSIQESLELPVLDDLLKSSYTEGATDDDAIPEEIDEKALALADSLGSGMVPQEVVEDRHVKDHQDAMDTVYTETMQHAKDLMDLGYNVDTRSAGRIFENAAGMYKLAIDAKNSKREAQLKKMKIEIERRKVDIVERQMRGEQGNNDTDSEEVIIENRNDLMARLRNSDNK